MFLIIRFIRKRSFGVQIKHVTDVLHSAVKRYIHTIKNGVMDCWSTGGLNRIYLNSQERDKARKVGDPFIRIVYIPYYFW